MPMMDAKREVVWRPSKEDFDISPAIVENRQFMLPDRDSNAFGVTKCAVCLLIPKGTPHHSAVLAFANPDRVPQRAWFLEHHLKNMVHRDHPELREWKVDEAMTAAKLTIPGDRSYIWRLTDFRVQNTLRLGVWID